MINVIKRNGSKVPFDKNKIISAINKAFLEVDEKVYENDTAEDIAEEINDLNEDLSVEDIQNLVEEYLMRSERKDVARAYIRYRYKKEIARNHESDFIDAIKEKLQGHNIQNSNANVDENSFGGRYGEAADVVTKQIALDYYVSDIARENHINNMIYIHDLSAYPLGNHNCLSIPFDDLLATGFNTRQVDIRPAGSINTAFQLVAVIFQLQSLQQFGGVSSTHLDWTMVPYVRKSFYKHWKKGIEYIGKILYPANEWSMNGFNNQMSILDYPQKDDYKEVYDYALAQTEDELAQAVEGLFHNLNSLQSRSGCQLPFTSVNLGTCILPEGRMVNKAMLQGCISGVGKLHKTAVFPCLIFQCMKNINRHPGDPNYDLFRLALESTAKRLYPNYANCDWSGNVGYNIDDPTTYFSTMGKRKLQLM